MVETEIRIFDFNLRNMESYIQEIGSFQPDVIGISLRNVDDVNSLSQESFLADYLSIMENTRKTTTVPVVIGGAGYSIYPIPFFEYLKPDFAISGEGEESLFQLLKSLETGDSYESIEGITYLKNGKVCHNQRNQFLRSLDLELEPELIDFYWQKSGMMNIQTRRGCPYNCIYCTYPLIEGSKVRNLDIDRIIKTMKDLAGRKISYFFFTDSVFNLQPSYNEALCREIIRNKLDIHWGAYFSPNDLTYDMLALYKEAGLTHIEFGTESFSDRQLKNYGKHFTMKDVEDVSDICNRLEIYHAHFLILGGYGETERTLDESFENSKHVENSVFFPYIGMRIYPNTRLYQYAMKDGIIEANDNLLFPAYYIAGNIDYGRLKERAENTGKRWVFPDEDVVTVMNRMRNRNRKGSLWHHLKK